MPKFCITRALAPQFIAPCGFTKANAMLSIALSSLAHSGFFLVLIPTRSSDEDFCGSDFEVVDVVDELFDVDDDEDEDDRFERVRVLGKRSRHDLDRIRS